jgi:hypothetical protein
MRILASISLLAIVSCGPRVAPVTPAPPSAPAPSAPPLRASPASPVTESTIQAHLEFLASDALNGRGSGTRDEWIAATYVASQFRLWGLEPMGDDGGFVQAVELSSTEAVTPILTAGSVRLRHGDDMLVTPGWPVAVSAPLHRFVAGTPVPAGAAVLLPDATTLPSAAALAPAAIVLQPETASIRERWTILAARPLRLTPLRAVRLSPSTTTPAARQTRVVLSAASRAAIDALPDGATVAIQADLRPLQAFTWNAVGRLPGADSAGADEVIVLSAHLDHLGGRPGAPGTDTIFNGADDDASGTVAVMAIAEALSRGPRPRRSVVFALFGSEESGGIGAGFFVDLPVVPLAKIVADLQFEMLARPDPKIPPDHLWLTGFERSNLGSELARLGAQLVADPHPEQSFFTRSDNIRFARRGVVAHTVSSFNLHKEYHTVEDELRLVNIPYMTAAIRSLVEPIRRLADSTFKPAWNPGGCPAPCK